MIQEFESGVLAGKRIAVIGKLGGLTKKDTLKLIRDHGGRVENRPSQQIEMIVIGADHLPLENLSEHLEPAVAQAVRDGRIEVLQEPELWQHLGLVDEPLSNRQLYTPAMLADLLGISVRIVRRWHRTGLISPVKEVHRLPYFDYTEVSKARQLAQWVAEGATVESIQQQLAAFSQLVSTDGRSLEELSIVAEGKRLLLRQADGLIESSGQKCIDFDLFDDTNTHQGLQPATISIASLLSAGNSQADMESGCDIPTTLQQMLREATCAEDEDRLDSAIDWYRAALAGHGANADICFQLAELLYRSGDTIAARERYYVALELNPELVEARANLGCVLAELGQLDLAIAAFEGTLSQYEGYADVHYHLARVLDETKQPTRATEHWLRFLELSPASPWADEAEDRIALASTERK